VRPFTGQQRSYWLLPGQQLPAEAQAHDTAELDAWLRRLEERTRGGRRWMMMSREREMWRG
jgi:hypothetical protein